MEQRPYKFKSQNHPSAQNELLDLDDRIKDYLRIRISSDEQKSKLTASYSTEQQVTMQI